MNLHTIALPPVDEYEIIKYMNHIKCTLSGTYDYVDNKCLKCFILMW